MTGVTVVEEHVDMGDESDNGATSAVNTTSNKFGLHKYCLSNLWKDGLDKMKKKDFIEVSANKDARKDRKQGVAKFIIQTVREGRLNNATTIGVEMDAPAPAPWCDTVHELDLNYYR